MKHSRFTSLIKSAVSTAAGFGLSLLLQWLVLSWLLGIEIPLHTNMAFACVMTVASLVRGYVLDRVFEVMFGRRSLSAFMQAAIAERWRQIDQEGWSLDHDDAHAPGEMAKAGGTYAQYAGTPSGWGFVHAPLTWPWSAEWWKPAGFRRDLVKACSLIIAEGEKFDRQRKRKSA